MGQAVVDLPDPLAASGEQAGNAKAQSADDLLSQLAGDEIDRMLAESGEEPGRKASEISPKKDTENEAVANPQAKSPLETEMDLDAAIDAAARERAAIKSSEQLHKSAPDPAPQIELGDSVRRLPLFLRPLEWISAPLDPWPDQLRDILGKVGLLTLVNALAVIAYVLIFRRHHH